MSKQKLGIAYVESLRKREILEWSALILVIATWYLLLAPIQLGGPTAFIRISGPSMQPTLNDGDLVVSRSKSEYQIGDLVVYQQFRGLVIHRIISGTSKAGWKTQGDNRSEPDSWTVQTGDILGEVWFTFPGVGKYFDGFQSNPINLGLFSAACATVVALLDGRRKTLRLVRDSGKRLSIPTSIRRRLLLEKIILWVSLVAVCVALISLSLVLSFESYATIISTPYLIGASAVAITLGIVFWLRIFSGLGWQEPIKSEIVLQENTVAIKSSPLQLENLTFVSSAGELKRISDRNGEPIIQVSKTSDGRNQFVLFTSKHGIFAWSPPRHVHERLAKYFEQN